MPARFGSLYESTRGLRLIEFLHREAELRNTLEAAGYRSAKKWNTTRTRQRRDSAFAFDGRVPGTFASRWREAMGIALIAVQTQHALFDEIRQNIRTHLGRHPEEFARLS